MILLLIILSAIISPGTSQQPDAIDVIKQLKSTVPDCQLSRVFKDENDFQSLEDDLTQVCSSASNKTIENAIMCRIIYSELKRVCSLIKADQNSLVTYRKKTSAEQICSMKQVPAANKWILQVLKLSSNNSHNLTEENLCARLTNQKSLVGLSRLFYKLSPIVVELAAQSTNNGSTTGNKSTNVKDEKESLSVHRNRSRTGSTSTTSQPPENNSTSTRPSEVKPTDETARVRPSNNQTVSTSSDVKETTKPAESTTIDGRTKSAELVLDLSSNSTIHVPTTTIDKPQGNKGEKETGGRAEEEKDETQTEPADGDLVDNADKENEDKGENAPPEKEEPADDKNPPANKETWDHRTESGQGQQRPSDKHEPTIVSGQSVKSKYPEDEGWSGSFVTYFLLATLVLVVGYLVLHNKNKLLGFIVEGRPKTKTSREANRSSYRYDQLQNVNDVIDLDRFAVSSKD